MHFNEIQTLFKLFRSLKLPTILYRHSNTSIASISLTILTILLACAPAALISYMVAVRRRRYQGINKLLKKYPDPTLPLRDLEVANEIWSFVSDCEFPFMTGFGTQVSLIKTSAVPSMSKIFVSTRQLTHVVDKRLEDTLTLLSEATQTYSRRVARSMIRDEVDVKTGKITTTVLDPDVHYEIDEEERKERANDEKRAQTAVDRINFLHSHYKIQEEDFVYSMAKWAVEPTDFIDKYEWRKLTELEKNASFAIWSDLLRKMNLKDIPPTLEEYKTWTDAYDDRKMKISPANKRMALGALSVPEGMAKSPRAKAFIKSFYLSLLEPKFIDAMELEQPSWAMRCFSYSVLWLRGRFVKYFMFPRTIPHVITALRATQFEDVSLIEGPINGLKARRDAVKSSEATSCPFTGGNRYVPRFFIFKNVHPLGYKVEEVGPLSYFGKSKKTCPFVAANVGREV